MIPEPLPLSFASGMSDLAAGHALRGHSHRASSVQVFLPLKSCLDFENGEQRRVKRFYLFGTALHASAFLAAAQGHRPPL